MAFGTKDGGPYEKWFTVDSLPDKETLRTLFREGCRYVHLCEILATEPVLAELRARGTQISDVVESRPAGWRSVVREETRTRLGMTFGRAITKIALNYLAHEYGAGTATMAAFNTARRFAAMAASWRRRGSGPRCRRCVASAPWATTSRSGGTDDTRALSLSCRSTTPHGT